MGYGSVYANDMISCITPRESRFLDRLFVKALRNTDFGITEKERIDAGKKSGEDLVVILEGKDVDRMHGAETLYQQTGLYFFGDGEFAFRRFSDTKEYDFLLKHVQKLPLLVASQKILERLPKALDKALVEIERSCSYSRMRLVTEKSAFRDGAWQLYVQAQQLIPELLTKVHDRRTIKKHLKIEESKKSPTIHELLSTYN